MRARTLLAGLAIAAAAIQSAGAQTAPKTDHKPPSILLVGASGIVIERLFLQYVRKLDHL